MLPYRYGLDEPTISPSPLPSIPRQMLSLAAISGAAQQPYGREWDELWASHLPTLRQKLSYLVPQQRSRALRYIYSSGDPALLRSLGERPAASLSQRVQQRKAQPRALEALAAELERRNFAIARGRHGSLVPRPMPQPGAPDIPGFPPGTGVHYKLRPEEGPTYTPAELFDALVASPASSQDRLRRIERDPTLRAEMERRLTERMLERMTPQPLPQLTPEQQATVERWRPRLAEAARRAAARGLQQREPVYDPVAYAQRLAAREVELARRRANVEAAARQRAAARRAGLGVGALPGGSPGGLGMMLTMMGHPAGPEILRSEIESQQAAKELELQRMLGMGELGLKRAAMEYERGVQEQQLRLAERRLANEIAIARMTNDREREAAAWTRLQQLREYELKLKQFEWSTSPKAQALAAAQIAQSPETQEQLLEEAGFKKPPVYLDELFIYVEPKDKATIDAAVATGQPETVLSILRSYDVPADYISAYLQRKFGREVVAESPNRGWLKFGMMYPWHPLPAEDPYFFEKKNYVSENWRRFGISGD